MQMLTLCVLNSKVKGIEKLGDELLIWCAGIRAYLTLTTNRASANCDKPKRFLVLARKDSIFLVNFLINNWR